MALAAETRAARTIRLVALGAAKGPAVVRALAGPDPGCPASLLAGHADCLFALDEAAEAARLVS